MDESRIEHLGEGRVEVWRRPDGLWGVTWLPHKGHPDYPSVTYTPGDPDSPSDFPNDYDVEALVEWARRRWACGRDERSGP